MVGGGTLQITLTTGILGHASQINTQGISVYIFRTIKASYRICMPGILLMMPK